MTPTQYVIAILIKEEDQSGLDNITKVIGHDLFVKDVHTLRDAGYLYIEDDETIVVTEKFYKTLKGKGYFDMFFKAFPTSVIRQDGVRDNLRTAKSRCATLYNRIVKSAAKHEHIVNCLKFEIQERTKKGTLGYMKRMPNWIRDEQWKDWEDLMKTDKVLDTVEDIPYGTEII